MTTSTRIVWSAKEWNLVLDGARALGYPEHGDSVDVWKRANMVLAESRRRKGSASDMARMNAARREANKEAHPSYARHHRAIGREIEAKPKLAAEVVPLPPKQEAPPPVALESVPGGMSSFVETAASLIKEVVLRVLYDSELRIGARDLIKEVLAPEVADKVEMGVLWRDPVIGQEKRKRVVIAAGGGFAANIEVLRPLQRFYDLRYWDSRKEHSARLRTILAGAHAAVIVTNSISHSGAATVREWGRAGKGQVLQYTRNVASLAEELPRMLNDEVVLRDKG